MHVRKPDVAADRVAIPTTGPRLSSPSQSPAPAELQSAPTGGAASVIVLGMHRSGTSALARCMNLVGLPVGPEGDLSPPAPDNPRGFWENHRLTKFNERILERLGGDWCTPPVLGDRWWSTAKLADLRSEAAHLVEQTFGDARFVWKDPRNCLLLPFWRDVLPSEPILVFIRRNPLEICRSLEKRNGFRTQQSLALWAIYVESALHHATGLPLIMVDYAELLDRAPECIARLRTQLEALGVPDLVQPSEAQLSEFLSDELRHWRRSDDAFLTHPVACTYQKNLYGYLRSLPPFTPRFDGFEGLRAGARQHAMLTVVRARHSQLMAALAGYEHQIALAASELHRMEASVTSLESELAEMGGRLCSALNDVEVAQTRVAELEREVGKIPELESALATASEQRGHLEAELNITESELAESLTRVGHMRDAVRALEQAVAERDSRIRDLTAARTALTARLAALEANSPASRIAEYEERCRQLELEVRDERARSANAETEARQLCRSLADLERQLKMREDEVASLRESEARLQSDLARAEQRRRMVRPACADAIWALARFAWKRLPVGQRLRDGGKAAFYGLLRRVHPTSQRLRRFDEYVQFLDRQRAAADLIAAIPAPLDHHGPRAFDVLVFPVIDWYFRHQRPQHLALELGARGHRVFYFATTFDAAVGGAVPDAKVVAPNVHLVTLRCSPPHPVIYNGHPSAQQAGELADSIAEIRRQFDLSTTVSIVDHPFWYPVASALTNNRVVYDCMDHHGGFSNAGPQIDELERCLIQSADLVVVSSDRLAARHASAAKRLVTIRNAAEYDHFAKPRTPAPSTKQRPIIGYYGAIAEWFDSDLVASAARAIPDCDFVLVGSTAGADLRQLTQLPNVHLIGETPYAELPQRLHTFDVCMIPFRVNELTLCTNPVKVYEYLSAGKPVVATALPELRRMSDMVAVAATTAEFIAALRAALDDNGQAAQDRRRAFARGQTWAHRGGELRTAIDALHPRVSIVVLTHNQLEFTQACLHSLDRFTNYPNWELIVVDNASADGTPAWLRAYAQGKQHVKLIMNDANVGFAAGCNTGARIATGDFIVFLNNDTYVTEGWMLDMIRHFEAEPRLAMLNPVTNNIGNEARIEIAYSNMDQMALAARAHTRQHAGHRFRLPVAAFFCVMLSRRAWQEIGELDEQFGQGFFEDDDYARRAEEKGFFCACADDVFVHHHLSATFNQIDGDRRQALFQENRRRFEAKWGSWTPHRYRARNDMRRGASATREP